MAVRVIIRTQWAAPWQSKTQTSTMQKAVQRPGLSRCQSARGSASLGTKSNEQAGTKPMSGSQRVHPVILETNGGNAAKPGQSNVAAKNSDNDKAKAAQRPELSRCQSERGTARLPWCPPHCENWRRIQELRQWQGKGGATAGAIPLSIRESVGVIGYFD
jgi:hypothetical protein